MTVDVVTFDYVRIPFPGLSFFSIETTNQGFCQYNDKIGLAYGA